MTSTGLNFYRDADGEWRWQVKARNGEIVATGAEGYHNRSDCEAGARVALETLKVELDPATLHQAARDES